MYEIIPGILEKNWNEIERKLEIVKSFAKVVHIDIIDEKFASNLTFLDPLPFSKYSQELFFEVHMMVEDPIQYLKSYAKAGFKRFIGQVEKMPDQEEFVAQAQLLGEVGLAIDGPTDLSLIKVPYADLDYVLVMTIKAGESGRAFMPEYLEKVRQIRAKNGFLSIEVDGGINDKTLVLAKDAGANRFVSTSFIFGSQDPKGQYDLLQSKVS